MKNPLVFIFTIFPVLLLGQITFDPASLTRIAKGDQLTLARKELPNEEATTENYDVKWYQCYWKIDPQVDSISGEITTLFKPSGGGIDSMFFDLSHALTVDSVTWHGVPLAWTHASELLKILFPSTLPQLLPDSVSVYYHGVPPKNGFGSFVSSTHAGVPVIWTLSEPYGASDWWPCKNGLTDKADSLDVYIRTPANYKAASNGILESAVQQGTDIVFHWRHRYPIATYLICLAVTNYATFTDDVPFGATHLPVVNYVYPEDSAAAVDGIGAVVPMIQLYDSLFGIYPFQNEKYGHAEFGWGGGMEHQTMTFVSTFGFEVLAHELAHHWFGDKVTCGSWSDIWLNEGFATYLSGLCYEHLIPDLFQRFRQVRISSIVSMPGGSVFCTDTTDVNRIFDSRLSYAKGAMVLHQLREILGDSAFFAGLNEYLDDFRLSYGFARTADLKSHLESASGQDLTWYFDDWYTGQGYPTYEADWTQAGDTVSVVLSQAQSDPSVSFFKLPVEIEFKSQARDTLIRFWNTYSGQSFQAIVPFPVDSVILDPRYNIISGNHAVSAVTEHALTQLLNMFPVPAKDFVTVMIPGAPGNGRVQIRIYDYTGHLVDEQMSEPGKTAITLSTVRYSPGLYICRIERRGSWYQGKFQVVK